LEVKMHDVTPRRSVSACVCVCALMWIACDKPAPTASERAQAFYATRPEYERPLTHSGPPAGLEDMDAETCGACHRAIYDEWAVSTHRRAWLGDAQFQEELAKSQGKHDPKSGDVGWLCVNCHTPVAAQQQRWVVALTDDKIERPVYVDNPDFKPSFQEDAITCAGCHVRDGIVYGPYGDTQAPHPVKKGDYLLDERVCVRCHQAQAMYPQQNLGCFFGTGEEWAASPAGRAGQTCQSCHMPEIERHVADNFVDRPKRKTRRHWFGGSLIPKHPDWEAEVAPLRALYGSGATVNLVRIEQAVCEGAPCVRVVAQIKNDRAGHHFPTGDPERHAELVVRVKGPDGQVAGESRARYGARYKWWPKIELQEDTRIPAGQARELVVEVKGGGADSVWTVEIEAHKWRMYEEAYTHHKLEGRYVRGRLFHRSRWEGRAGEAARLVEIEQDQPR
jgi:hypothetical protein